MALQELDYTIAYVRGSENTVEDAMSRLCANLFDLVIKVHPATTGTEPDNLPGPFCGALKVIPEMTDTQRDALATHSTCATTSLSDTGALNAPSKSL